MDADLSVCGALDGIERKRGTEQVAADAFESVSVAAIHRDGGMQLHAEGGDVRGAMLEHDGVSEDTPWMVPDVSALIPSGPVALGTDRFEIPDPEDPGEPYVIDIDETLELGDALPDLLRSARAEWHALCWLLWSSGANRLELPTRMNPPKKFGEAAGMAPARFWRCRDRVHMQGTGARTQGVPGFEWNGVDIDELPGSLTNMAMFEYQEMQALMYWLTDDEVRSPWQDNLRGS